jgi:hypothetical protein
MPLALTIGFVPAVISEKRMGVSLISFGRGLEPQKQLQNPLGIVHLPLSIKARKGRSGTTKSRARVKGVGGYSYLRRGVLN